MIKEILRKIISPTSIIRCPYGTSLLSEVKMKNLISGLNQTLDLEGNVIECGVFRGGSLIKIAQALKNRSSKKIIYGLDTFNGHPYTDNNETPIIKGYEGKVNFIKINKLIFDDFKLHNVILLKGLFRDTFLDLEDEKFCFAHIDCNSYLSHIECLLFLLPRVPKNGIILFDDYNTENCKRVQEAIYKFIKREDLIILGKQAYYQK